MGRFREVGREGGSLSEKKEGEGGRQLDKMLFSCFFCCCVLYAAASPFFDPKLMRQCQDHYSPTKSLGAHNRRKKIRLPSTATGGFDSEMIYVCKGTNHPSPSTKEIHRIPLFHPHTQRTTWAMHSSSGYVLNYIAFLYYDPRSVSIMQRKRKNVKFEQATPGILDTLLACANDRT